jgi:hypothetical protein
VAEVDAAAVGAPVTEEPPPMAADLAMQAGSKIYTDYVGFLQFLRHFPQLTACEQAEMIWYAA